MTARTNLALSAAALGVGAALAAALITTADGQDTGGRTGPAAPSDAAALPTPPPPPATGPPSAPPTSLPPGVSRGDGPGGRPDGGRPGRGGPGGGEGPTVPAEDPASEDGPVDRSSVARFSGNEVELNFPNNPVTDLLGIYEQLTEKTLIKDTSIMEGQSISLVTPKPVTRPEAVQLIEASLLVNGYAVVEQPGGKSVKILPTGGETNQASFSDSVRVYKRPEDLPIGESVAGYFMPLSHLNPEAAAETFAEHVGLNPYGRITPVNSPAGLLITENASIIRQLIDIQAVLDVEDVQASITTEFVELEYADASTVAQIIQSTLDARREVETGNPRTIAGQARPANNSGNNNNNDRGRGPGGGPPSFRPPGVPGATSNDSSDGEPGASEDPPSQLVADARLNRIMIIAAPTEFDYIKSLIQQFDQPVTDDRPLEYPLQYTYAEELLPVLVDVLQDNSDSATQLPGGGTLRQDNQLQSSARTSSLTGLAGRGGRDAQTGNTGAGGQDDQIETGDEDYSPVSVLVGKTRIIADPRANSIIAFGPRESLERITEIIDVLDKRPPQVQIATVLGQLTLGDDIEFGLDFLQKFVPADSSNPTGGGVSSSNINALSSLLGAVTDNRTGLIANPVGLAAGLGIYGAVGSNLDVFVTALEETSRFKVLDRPVIYASNGKKAVITSGQRIPVPVSALTSTNQVNNGGNNITTNIDYQDVVLKLEVLPLINSNGEVNLVISQLNDTVIGEQQVAENTVPIIATEELTTNVTVMDGETIVLGGLISEEDSEIRGGVPVISRVPVLGAPFRTTDTETTRRELLVFVQPRVIRDPREAREASLSEDLRTGIGADAYEAFPPSDEVIAPRALSLEEWSAIQRGDAPPRERQAYPQRPQQSGASFPSRWSPRDPSVGH